MKKRKLLYLFPLAALILSSCSIQEVGQWFGKNLVDPVKNLFTGKKDQEEEHHDEEENHEEQQQEQEEQEHTYTVHSNAYEHWKIRDDGVEVGREAHKFETVSTTAATCNDVSHEVLKCTECEFSKIVHGHEHLEHQYTSRITKEATCQQEGEITFTCDLCGDVQVQKFSKAEAHHLVLKSEEGNVKTFMCDVEGCDFEKTVIDASSQKSAEVQTQDLKDTGEIQLQDAAIAFDDETLDDFGDNVTISAEKQDVADVAQELNLDQETQDKLAGKPVIDFSVTQNDENISTFAGSVKISVDYELAQGEDAEGIAVWYLSENGTEPISASYVNGKVSFETNHFSYYAVVHLPAEEACEHFGHIMMQGGSVESTCTAYGYEDMICRRCGKIERNLLPLKPHDYHYVSKLDATTSSEGYIRYECKDCHDTYDTVLPKLDSDNRPFYVNLLYSAMTPDFKLYSTAMEDGEVYTMEAYQGLDYEGIPFSYTTDGSGYYKGYRYYSDYDGYEGSYYSFDYSVIREIINYIPDIYKENFDDIVGWAFDKYLVKEEIAEGYKFTLNYEAIQETIHNVLEEDLETAIISIIGEERYESILGFIEDHYDMTVGEFIDDIENRGYHLDELYDAIINIAKVYGLSEDAEIPTLDDLIPEQAKSMKVYEYINQFIASMTSNSGHSSAEAEDHEEPIPQPYPLGEEGQGEEGQGEEGQGEEGQGGVLPETYEELKEMLDGFLSKNLFDLIAEFAEMDADEIKEQVKSVTDLITEEHVLMTLLTTKDGGFISFGVDIYDFDIPVEDVYVEYGHSLITKDFNKAEILNILERKAEKYQTRLHAFDIDASNYKWLAKPFEDYYSQTYPGIKFEYYENYGDNDYDALISNMEIATGNSYHPTGRLILRIPDKDSYSYYYGRGELVYNSYGLGTALPEGEYGVINDTDNLLMGTSSYIVKEGELTTETHGYYAPSFGLLYRLEDGGYRYTCEDGSFNYLEKNYYRYEVSSYEEYMAYINEKYHGSYKPHFENVEEVVFLKVINVLDGSYGFDYYYRYDWDDGFVLRSSTILSKNMNDEALEMCQNFRIEYTYYNGVITEKLRDVSCPLDYTYAFGYQDEDLAQTYTVQRQYGNVTISYVNKPGSATHKCMRDVSWKVCVNNSAILSRSYKSHLYCEDWVTITEISEEEIEQCYWRTTYSVQCNICGKYLPNQYNYNYVHEHKTEHHQSHEATLTTAGYDIVYYTCDDCGRFAGYDYSRCSYEGPCRHENGHAEGDKFVCDDCGYEVDSPNGVRPELIYEQYEINSENYVAFSVFAPRLTHEFQYLRLDNYYSFQLCVGYFDENGEFQTYANANESDIYWSRVCLEDLYNKYDYYHEYYSFIYCNLVVFNRQAYYDLLEQAQSEHPEQEFVVTIAAVAYDAPEGTAQVFYYTIDQAMI